MNNWLLRRTTCSIWIPARAKCFCSKTIKRENWQWHLAACTNTKDVNYAKVLLRVFKKFQFRMEMGELKRAPTINIEHNLKYLSLSPNENFQSPLLWSLIWCFRAIMRSADNRWKRLVNKFVFFCQLLKHLKLTDKSMTKSPYKQSNNRVQLK